MKVLLISPYFPPYNAIGAVRTGKLAKFLTARGHEVRVIAAITPELSETLRLEVPEESVTRCPNYSPDALFLRYVRRRVSGQLMASVPAKAPTSGFKKFLLYTYNSFFCIPDRFFGWLPFARRASRRLISEFKPDIVYASAQPYSALLVGKYAARRAGVPLVAEFRDLWTDNHYLELPRWRAHFDHWLEASVCRNAAALITISEPLAETLAKRHGRPTEVVYNGFDPEDVVKGTYAPKKTFEIIYTGIIYPGRRDPSPLFRVLRKLGDDAAHVRVRFYGRRLETVRDIAEREGVAHLVSIEGEVSYHEALSRQAEADVLLLLLWDTPEERGVLTGKIFEYLASKRPILLIGGGKGIAAQLLQDRRAGHAASSDGALEAQMRLWLRQHAQGGVPYLPDSVSAGFSRSEQFEHLANHLTEIATLQRLRIVTLKLDVGGTEKHLLQLLPRLDRRRFDVEVITIYQGGALEEEFRAKGIRVTTPKAHRRIPAIIESTIRIIATMRRDRGAIFHFWLPEAYLLGGICGVLTGTKLMVMSRRSLNRYQERHPFLARLERVLHRHMGLILGNSEAIANELASEGVSSEKVKVITNGIDVVDLKPSKSRQTVRDELGIKNDTLLCICVANLIHYKGHADLLHALAIAQEQLGKNWCLICAGRDDGLGKKLSELATEYNLDKHVRLLGSRQDIPDLLNASDVSILPSHEEGFANAIIEAMAIGVPTIATNVGGNIEAIEDGVTGLLIPPKDPVQLAEAIVRLATDAPLRLAISEASKQDVLKRRGIASCTARYSEAYETLLRENGGNESA
ncbi:MAG: glycosyltransferase [Roseicyclus sp.]|uniref:glycosyltransferase n=1 Tax=Roseicyclus sp. TaxID=1914329 RepID=UPI003A848BB7